MTWLRQRTCVIALLAFVLFFLFPGFTEHLLPNRPKPGIPGRKWVEIDGIPPAKTFARPTREEIARPGSEWLRDELKARFHESQYPSCDNDLRRYSRLAKRPRFGHRRSALPISFAVILHDSEEILPSLSLALVEAIDFLLPQHEIYVSIFENGSNDRTKQFLADLVAALDYLGIDGLFIKCSHMKSDFGSEDRIVLLSELRNFAIDRVLSHAKLGTLVFLNDIITCASDILELVYQRVIQEADAVVGHDWIPRPTDALNEDILSDKMGTSPFIDSNASPQVRLYDVWATRGINGEIPYEYDEKDGLAIQSLSGDWIEGTWATQSEEIHSRWLCGMPFPIYGGWGGMIALDATLFTDMHLRFRSSVASGWSGSAMMGAWGHLVASEGYLQQDCPGSSECDYVWRDIWNLRNGRARIVAAPRARSAYSVGDFTLAATMIPSGIVSNRTGLRCNSSTPSSSQLGTVSMNGAEAERIDWEHVTIPSTVLCISSRTATGESKAVWDGKMVYLNPQYRVPRHDDGLVVV